MNRRPRRKLLMGIRSYTPGTVTPTAVSDAAAVRQIIEQFNSWLLLQVVTAHDGTGILRLNEHEEAWGAWPSAVRNDELPAVDPLDKDGVEWDQVMEDTHRQRGQDGLNELFLAIA